MPLLVPGHCDICDKPCMVPDDGHKSYFNVTCGSPECNEAVEELLRKALGDDRSQSASEMDRQ